MKLRKYKISNIILGTYFFLAPFGVSTTINNLIPGMGTSQTIIGIVFVYFSLYFLKGNMIRLNKFEKNIIFLFVVPIILSVLGMLVGLLTIKEPEYIQYIIKYFPTRLFLIIANVTLIVGLLSITSNWEFSKIKSLIKKYYFGLLLFISVGVWQFFHFLLGIPYLNIQTRDHIHSVDRARTFFINGRLTSFADEPSYLAPLVIDLMILALLISKKPWRPVTLGIFVLMFSYSSGGYMNLVILLPFLIIGYMKYKHYKFNKNNLMKLTIIVFIGLFFIITKSDKIYDLVYPVLGRLDTLFDINKHSRMFMIFMPFLWTLEGNFVNLIFGYGPKSYAFLRLTKFLPSGTNVHLTSNNLFSDTVFELGYVGFISYLTIFTKIILVSFRRIKNNKEYFIAMLLTVHLVATSIYRADFMQSRFWVIMFIILKLMEEGSRKMRVGSK